MKITFITGNLGKVEEASRYLGILMDHQKLDLDELQTLDIEEIVRHKALQAFELVKTPILVEDSALVFHSLGKLPGPLIKWFEKEIGNEGLCRLVDGKDRTCTATACYGFYDGKNFEFFTGSMDGSVSDTPKGENGFGWAPVFIPDGYEKTYAEMTKDEQAVVAMRSKALKKFREFIDGK